MMKKLTLRHVQILLTLATVFIGTMVAVLAQNPVSIAQIGTTRLTTTMPISGAVTGSGNFTVVNAGTFAVQAAQSGTWTVQPGNTANVTAWLVTGTGGTFPATQSGAWSVTANAGTNLNTSLLALESGGNLATLAGIVSAARAAVNPIAGQVGVQGASGVVTALTQRMVLATDVALPTGTNSIGQVTANAGTNLNTSLLALESGGNLATLAGIVSAARAAVNTIAGQVGVQGASGVVTALTQRVVLATDVALPTGTNSIGQVTANAGTNLNTSLLALDSTLTGRFPAGASPADNESNTNTSLSRIGTFPFVFDGSTWDRWTGAVTCASGCGTLTDNSAFTFGSTSIIPTGFVYDDTAPNAVTENAAATPRMSANRVPYAQLRDAAGNERGANVTAKNELVVYDHSTEDLDGDLDVILSDLHAGALHSFNDRMGFSLRGTFNKPIGSVGDALKVSALPLTDDGCFTGRKGNIAISQTTSTKLVSGLPGRVIAVCYVRVVAGAAEIPSLLEGTGSACGTGTAAVSGSTTAANGESLAANGGFSGGMGLGTVAVTKTPGNDLCLGQSGSNRLAGVITYVYAMP